MTVAPACATSRSAHGSTVPSIRTSGEVSFHAACPARPCSGSAQRASGSAEAAALDDSRCRVWLGHIPRAYTELKLKDRVACIGTVKKIHVMESRVENGLRAAFVHMATPADAERVIAELHEQKFDELDAKPLIARLANPPRGLSAPATSPDLATAAKPQTGHYGLNTQSICSAAALSAASRSIRSSASSDLSTTPNGQKTAWSTGNEAVTKAWGQHPMPLAANDVRLADDCTPAAADHLDNRCKMDGLPPTGSCDFSVERANVQQKQDESIQSTAIEPEPSNVADASSWPMLTGSTSSRVGRGGWSGTPGAAATPPKAQSPSKDDISVPIPDPSQAWASSSRFTLEAEGTGFGSKMSASSSCARLTVNEAGGSGCNPAYTPRAALNASSARLRSSSWGDQEDSGIEEPIDSESTAPASSGVPIQAIRSNVQETSSRCISQAGWPASDTSATRHAEQTHPLMLDRWRKSSRSPDQDDAKSSSIGETMQNIPVGDDEHLSRLWVGHLTPRMTESRLRDEFSTYGSVVHIHIMEPKVASFGKCSSDQLRAAFVTMGSSSEAGKALSALHDKKMNEVRPLATKARLE